MNRKQRVYAVLKGQKPDRTPTGFWMHFPPDAFYGTQAVNTHLDYFARTQTDLCKVMTEFIYPCDHSIRCARDWRGVPAYGADAPFITGQADIVRALAERCPDAPIVATLHGIVASASHTQLGVPRYDSVGRYAQLYHLRTDPGSIQQAYHNIAQTLCCMVRALVEAGADGIYYAALGGERDGFTREEHATYIAPLDRMVIESAYASGARFVILHMCKPLVDLERFTDYPCDVVNWGVRESGVSLREGARLFPGKVLLGGLDNRCGPLPGDDPAGLEQQVWQLLDDMADQRFILGSDCTLPGDLPYSHIAAVAQASARYAAGGRGVPDHG